MANSEPAKIREWVSFGRGGESEWPVHEGYEVRGGALCPVGAVSRSYDPLAYPQIVTQIARLNERDEGALVAFAQTWGLLGYPSVPPENGDPLPWVGAHTRGIHMVLNLHSYLQRPGLEGLRQFLRSHKGSHWEYPTEESLNLTVGTPRHWGFKSLPWAEEAPADMAHDAIAAIMNPNLRGVCYQFSRGTRARGFRPILSFFSLGSAAYWHVFNILTGRRLLGRCEECGQFFVKTDRRQKFCPPLPQPRGLETTTGSLCGARYRKRRQRPSKGG